MRRRLGPCLLNITPAGKVLPCHAAELIPGLEFWSVREHSLADICETRRAFNAFRHGMDGRAVQILRPARYRLRRLPLPGVRVDRGCARRLTRSAIWRPVTTCVAALAAVQNEVA